MGFRFLFERVAGVWETSGFQWCKPQITSVLLPQLFALFSSYSSRVEGLRSAWQALLTKNRPWVTSAHASGGHFLSRLLMERQMFVCALPLAF